MLLALHNLYPSLRPYTQPFFELSYYNPATNQYVQGWDDVYFVFSAALALTAVRAIAIEWVIQPLARQAGLGRKGSVRLAEQGWQVMYYSFVWATGLVCLVFVEDWLVGKHVELLTLVPIVPLEELLLLVRLQCHLGWMACSPYVGNHEVVLVGWVGLSHPVNLHYSCWGETEGSLPNVRTPHHHQHTSYLRLYLRLLQCVKCGTLSDGHCRLFASGTIDSVLVQLWMCELTVL